MDDARALDGLKVLDLTQLLAAPQVAATLGDFGADVIKIEGRSGDPLRKMGASRGGSSPQWQLVARNKRALSLDLDHAEGRRIFRDLVAKADVLVENLTPTLLKRWQCTYADLAEVNPRLIVVSVSCYGRSGPYSDRPGAGTLAEAFAGFAHLNGEAEGPPLVPSLPLGDTLVGMSGVIGTMMALYARDRAGRGSAQGQHVDVAMIDPILQLMSLPLAMHDRREPPPKRMGSRIAGGVPRNLYRCADGEWIALSGTTDRQVERILSVIGRDSAADQARYAAAKDRLRHADELDGLVADWIGARTRAEVMERFVGVRIPVAPVNDLSSLLEDPHLQARASVAELSNEQGGSGISVFAPSPALSLTPGRHSHGGPSIGAHNTEVLTEWLGLEASEVEELERIGAL
ncbi:MAG: CaiB/BaiF CoA transferase family protein [Myxococcota bacterium]